MMGGILGYFQERCQAVLGEIAWGVYLASLDPEAEAPTLAGAAGRHLENPGPRWPPGQGGSGTKPWGRGHSSRTWSKVLVTAEAGPSPSHLPSSLRSSWGQFPETGYGPPNQLGTVSAPEGQVSQGIHRLQVYGGCRPPIQCEGFLCSVVFLTPEGGGVPGGSPGSASGWPGSGSSVCCGSSGAAGPLTALPPASTGPGHPCLWSAPCSPEAAPGRGWQVESPRRGPSLGTRSRAPGGALAVARAGAKAVVRLTRSSTGQCGCEGGRAEVG